MNKPTNCKRCRSCWNKGHIGWHPLEDFPKSHYSLEGRASTCKKCVEERRERRERKKIKESKKKMLRESVKGRRYRNLLG